jgi:hypothetical protein
MKMWLDDRRDPILYTREMDWNWVKTAQEAIDLLRTGAITRASLDHDLTDEQMVKGGFLGQVYEDGHKSGYDVVCWLEQHPEFWPINGVKVHSANPSGAARMHQVIHNHYHHGR